MFDVTGADTAELLRPDQVDKFSDGLPSYYEHVMDLLGQVKASAQVAEFAKLALQAHNKDMEKAAEVSNSSVLSFTARILTRSTGSTPRQAHDREAKSRRKDQKRQT